AIYNNRTDLIVSQETAVGDNWSVCVTPNNGSQDGTEVCSLNLTVLEVPESSNYFTFQVNTTSPSQNFTFYVEDADLTVNWTDGNATDHSGNGLITHMYDSAGVHNISVNGTTIRLTFHQNFQDTTPELLYDILTPISDGVTGITEAGSMFEDTNITSFTASNFFDETSGGITYTGSMFSGSQFNQDINNWDVSNVTDMRSMFQHSQFNQNISNWNVSGVTVMNFMFDDTLFNQDINDWDVSNVDDMRAMFYSSQFNKNISNWNVSSVTDMGGMFSGSQFNQSIANWDVSNVTDMSSMFYNSPFNQNISAWNLSVVTDISSMFFGSPFNQSISDWDVSNVEDMRYMFYDSQFNQNISNWNVSNVVDMSQMFKGSKFNKNIGSWDVSNVTDMSFMFYNALFNQSITNWSVSGVTDMRWMFRSSEFNRDIGSWDVSNVENMQYMFYGAPFDQNIGSWDVSNVTDFSYMFSSAQLSRTNYDALLNGWSSLPELNYNLSFHAGTSQYCLGESARNNTLIDVYNWTITDGDKDCSGLNIITSQTNITVSGTYYLIDDIINSADTHFINISTNDVILDCQGRTIDGSDHDGYGIYVYRDAQEWTNITITNCIVTDWGTGTLTDESGIYLKNIENMTLQYLNISSNFNGIIMENSDNNYVRDTIINDNTDNGLLFSSSNSNI
ncbi:BspA family leucine-rich repeat surface protein, partial [Candidatus Peregrinibacteria bacterium]|nr:BspA family leucine-rich repeat surface protein [Candidatus Peregrinibacteria bacterium]